MKTPIILLLLLVMQTTWAQLPVCLTLNTTDGKADTFTAETGRIFLRDFDKNEIHIYTEDDNGVQTTWKTFNKEEIRSLKFTVGVNETVLLTAENNYHATQSHIATSEITVEPRDAYSKWVVILPGSDAQDLCTAQLQHLTADNLGAQEESRLPANASERPDIRLFEGRLTVKNDAPIGQINICSLTGEVRMTCHSEEAELEINHDLPRGMYIISGKNWAEKVFFEKNQLFFHFSREIKF